MLKPSVLNFCEGCGGTGRMPAADMEVATFAEASHGVTLPLRRMNATISGGISGFSGVETVGIMFNLSSKCSYLLVNRRKGSSGGIPDFCTVRELWGLLCHVFTLIYSICS